MCRFPGAVLTYAQILPRLFIGSHPRTIDDIERLRREVAMTAILNLQTDDDMRTVILDWPPLEAHYKTCPVLLCRVPIVDVYLHCTAGIGRAPTVAIGYLHACLGWELDEAIAHVKQARQCAPHLEALRLSLADQGVLKSSDNGG